MSWQDLLNGQEANVEDITAEIKRLEQQLKETATVTAKLEKELFQARRDHLSGSITVGELGEIEADYATAATRLETLQGIISDLQALEADLRRADIEAEISDIDNTLADHAVTKAEMFEQLTDHFTKAGVLFSNITGHPAKDLDYSFFVTRDPTTWRVAFEKNGGNDPVLYEATRRLQLQRKKLEAALI